MPSVLHRRSMSSQDALQEDGKEPTQTTESIPRPLPREVYFNERLAPENYRYGHLSSNPATRLRQMLARPGIVVCFSFESFNLINNTFHQRLHLEFAMALAPGAL
jgi:hypothetical protein